MSNRIFFTHQRQGDNRFYWARDKYNILYIIRVHPKGGLLGAVLEALTPLHVVDWQDHPVHVDSMKKHLQKIADTEDETRVVIKIAKMEMV